MILDANEHYQGGRKFLVSLDDRHTYELKNGYYYLTITYEDSIEDIKTPR